MKDLKVWYTSNGSSTLGGDLTLSIKCDSIAYTIAEFESRNRDLTITAYMNRENTIVAV